MTTANMHVRQGRRLITALVVLVVLALVAWLAVTQLRAAPKATLTAMFADSSPLVPGNKVQLDGIAVGTISSISLVNGLAEVKMDVDPSVLPLHADATAQIQPVSLLGERFVALEQGTPSAPLMGSPAVIPVDRTSSSMDLDQLLSTLNDPTSTALAAMVTTLGEGVANQGGNVAQSIKALAPTLRQTDQLSTLLDQQNAVLDNLVVQAQKNATAFAQPLDSLVGAAQQTLGTVAANRQAMNDTLVQLPSTLSTARGTLGRLGDAADHTTDVLSGVRPLTDRLKDTSKELHHFADAADPALDSLPDVLEKVNHMLDEARPVVDDLGPAADGLGGVSSSVHTLSDQLFTHAPGVPSQLENVMTGAANWAMATSGYDGLSHYFRAVVVAGVPSALFNTGAGLFPPIGKTEPFNPVPKDPNPDSSPPGSAALPFMPSLPNPDGPDNSSYSTPKGAPRSDDKSGPGSANSGSADSGRADSDSASGMTPKQESDMFDQLLGGGK